MIHRTQKKKVLSASHSHSCTQVLLLVSLAFFWGWDVEEKIAVQRQGAISMVNFHLSKILKNGKLTRSRAVIRYCSLGQLPYIMVSSWGYREDCYDGICLKMHSYKVPLRKEDCWRLEMRFILFFCLSDTGYIKGGFVFCFKGSPRTFAFWFTVGNLVS